MTTSWSANPYHQRAVAEIWGAYVLRLLRPSAPEGFVGHVATTAFHLAGQALASIEAAS